MKKRVLIISTSAGTGHVRAAQALEKEFVRDPRVGQVVHEDALNFTNKLFRDFYSTLYMKLVRSAPDVLGWVYKASDEPWKGEAARTQLDRLNTLKLIRFIKEFDPHITVCTHFMPAGIISHLQEKGRLRTHHSIVVTDFDCHAMWLSRMFHRYFVALDETKAHLEALGLPADRITTSGIPIDPIFSVPVDREKVRASYGLQPDKTTLLLSAGALGVGPTEMIVERLKQLRNDVQTIVTCGRSEEAKTRVTHAVSSMRERFCVLGYSDRMHELMQISDLFIGKPGGLTTSEALACGLPMAVFSPIPGQEERNADHLLEEGAGIRCNELTTLPFKIDRLLDNPAHLAAMRDAARSLGHPHAARTVVETLLDDHLPPLALDSEQREAIALAAARALRPMDDFLWGVATSAYQAEGGYNGPGQPLTNWGAAEQRGDVAVVGMAADFWNRYEEDFARCRQLGLTGFRLGLEWSRIQPESEDANTSPPPFDFAALDHYATMIEACRRHGLEPVVTLHHFVHPAWLGGDPWLDGKTADLFAQYVRVAIGHVNERLSRPIRWFITINEPNMLVLNTYLGRQFPAKHGPGLNVMTKVYNQLLRAHVLAYSVVHDLYKERGWPEPKVTFNNYCSDVYWSDKMLLDLVCLRERGIPREDAGRHICQRAHDFEAAFEAARIPLHKDLAYYFGAAVKRLSNWVGYRSFDPTHFAPFLDTLYAQSRTRFLDYIGIDYYDPFAAHAFRLPVLWDHEFKNRSMRSWMLATVTSKWWDWRVLPRGLHFFCKYYAEDFGRSVLIAENGMALRRRVDARPSRRRRRDRMTRSQFLRLHVHEVAKIRADGVPLIGYLHWSLFDNYEWGTYTPRFGLFSIDFPYSLERQIEDPDGDRPAETYATLIADGGTKAHVPHPISINIQYLIMPAKSEFAIHMEEMLQSLGTIRLKSMFGGWGFYADERFFAIIADEGFYVKVDDVSRAEFEAQGLKPFRYDRGEARATLDYYELPPEALENRELLCEWGRKGLAAAERAVAKKKPRKKK